MKRKEGKAVPTRRRPKAQFGLSITKPTSEANVTKYSLRPLKPKFDAHKFKGLEIVYSEGSEDEADHAGHVEEESASEDESSKAEFNGIEVYPGLFVGGEGCALDSAKRKQLGVTSVLSVISEFEESFKAKSSMDGTEWKTLRLENAASSDLLGCLDESFEFINMALSKGGKAVVHSLEGCSRSTSLAIAYLMVHASMTLKAAYEKIQALVPNINVNRGFWRQLHALDVLLYKNESIREEDLPGAVIFEKEELDQIISKYLRKHTSDCEEKSSARKRVHTPDPRDTIKVVRKLSH